MFCVPNNNLIFFTVAVSLTLIPKLYTKGVASSYLNVDAYVNRNLIGLGTGKYAINENQ